METKTVSGCPRAIRYHANGNTSVINAAGSRTTYSWDIENMMTQAALPDGSASTFTYDGDKRRRSKGEGGSVTKFVRDGERVLLETDSGGSTQARYTVQGGDWFDGLISMRRGNASSFYHFDALGSADRLTDASQTPTDSYIQKAFGVLVASSGSTVNPFRFVARYGYYRDSATGLMQLGVRYYRDAVGRFVSRDQLHAKLAEDGAGIGLYLYAANGPVASTDPAGAQHDETCYQGCMMLCKAFWSCRWWDLLCKWVRHKACHAYCEEMCKPLGPDWSQCREVPEPQCECCCHRVCGQNQVCLKPCLDYCATREPE